MVKNCGACGSIAPPITVEIMAFLLCRKNIAACEPQQAARCAVALMLPIPLASHYALARWLADAPLCDSAGRSFAVESGRNERSERDRKD
jgi:hypothetical protein